MQNTWKKIAVGVSGASVIALSGAALSSAQASGGTAKPSTSASTQASTQAGPQGGPDGGMHHGHQHGTPVSAATLASLKKAVAAKDSGVTIEHAFKAKNGSFHAMGIKAGKRVHVEVSADMKTVTVRQGGPQGPGGPDGRRGHDGRHRGVEVTGAKLTSVKNAVKAKDSAVTVEKVFQGPKGEYHAMGTKAGKHVMVQVSQDLKKVTVMTGGFGHGGPGAGHGPADWKGAGTAAPNSQGSAA